MEQVIGLSDVKSELVILGTPDGQAQIELIKFHSPPDDVVTQESAPNTPGIPQIVFAVEDIEAVVAKLKKRGSEAFGEIHN